MGNLDPLLHVPVEANALRYAKCGRLAYVMQQDSQRQLKRRLTEPVEHDQRMGPDVALRVKLRRLRHTLQPLHFGQHFMQQACPMHQLEPIPRPVFHQNS